MMQKILIANRGDKAAGLAAKPHRMGLRSRQQASSPRSTP
jgi:acetyl/propionyl-CoA carboxylase alpha subunit